MLSLVKVSKSPEAERSTKSKKSRPLPPKPVANERLLNSMMVPSHYNPVPPPSTIPINMMQYVPPFNATANSVYYDTLLSETRTQNSEIRMHLCRLSDKLDLHLQKVFYI